MLSTRTAHLNSMALNATEPTAIALRDGTEAGPGFALLMQQQTGLHGALPQLADQPPRSPLPAAWAQTPEPAGEPGACGPLPSDPSTTPTAGGELADPAAAVPDPGALQPWLQAQAMVVAWSPPPPQVTPAPRADPIVAGTGAQAAGAGTTAPSVQVAAADSTGDSLRTARPPAASAGLVATAVDIAQPAARDTAIPPDDGAAAATAATAAATAATAATAAEQGWAAAQQASVTPAQPAGVTLATAAASSDGLAAAGAARPRLGPPGASPAAGGAAPVGARSAMTEAPSDGAVAVGRRQPQADAEGAGSASDDAHPAPASKTAASAERPEPARSATTTAIATAVGPPPLTARARAEAELRAAGSDRAGGVDAGPTPQASTPQAVGAATSHASHTSHAAGALPATAHAGVEARIPVPLDSPAFGPALGAQLSVFARDGVHTARLQLNPAEMGPILVQIALDGNAARVDFQADLAATRTLIEASLPALAGALQDAGLTLAGGGVFQQHSGRQGQAEAQPAAGSRPAADRDEAASGGPAPAAVARGRRGLVDLVA